MNGRRTIPRPFPLSAALSNGRSTMRRGPPRAPSPRDSLPGPHPPLSSTTSWPRSGMTTSGAPDEKGWVRRGPSATLTGVDEVEVVVAHHERATLRVGEVFLKIDADQASTDVEVEAMAMAPVPTPEVLWRKPPVLALAALPGSALGRLGRPSTASSAAWTAAGAAVRLLHDAPLPPWLGREPRGEGREPRHRVRVAPGERRPPCRPGHAQPRGGRGRAPAVDAGVHARRPAGRPRVRRR